MATIVHLEFLHGMVGDATHSTIDWDTDNCDVSLLDATDAGTILNSFVDYDEIDTNVVATTDLVTPSITESSPNVLVDFAATTFSAVTGDEADYLTAWKNSGTPSTSPLGITWDSATTGLPVQPNGGDITVTWGTSLFQV
jgi:hypothetical protein